MLSEREQRTFQEITQRIAADDPQFAAAMGQLGTRRIGRWSGRGRDVVVVLAVVSGLLCLLLALAGAALVALGLAAAAYSAGGRRPGRRLGRRPGRWRRRPGGSTGQPSGRP